MSTKIIILDYLTGKSIKDAEHSIIIESKEVLNSFLSVQENLNGILGFVIPAELTWGKRYYTDFGGLEIIYKIRLEYNLKVPIIITSFIPSINIQSSSSQFSPLFRCLQDPSINFISIDKLYQMDFTQLKESFESPLEDDLLLDDINTSLYDKNGYVATFLNEAIKELRFLDIQFKANEAEVFLSKKINQLKRFNITSSTMRLIEDHHLRFIKVEDFNSKKTMILFFQKIKEIINELAPQIEYFSSSTIEVLYVGNDIGLYDLVEKKLAPLSINFKIANNSQDAVEILKSNENIKVITCDFRFFEPTGKFSREQGYHVTRKIMAEVPRIYSLIILTSKELFYTPKFFRNQKVSILRKDELLRQDRGIINFGRLIYEQNIWVNNTENNLPEFGKMLGVYLQHINKDDYELEEKMISDFAIAYIKKVRSKNLENVYPIQNISGSVINDGSEKSLNNLRVKLKARRVLLGLYQLDSSYLNDSNNNMARWSVIYSLLQSGSNNKNVPSSTIQPFLSKRLIRIQTNKSYHWRSVNNLRLTQKEKEWLIQHGNALENNLPLP